MSQTPNLALPYILAAQAQKHVTHNEAIRALDCLVQLSVLDRDLSAPPSSPANGARYIVGASPSGAWSGHAGKVAAYQDGAWVIFAPAEGWLSWVADEDVALAWDGAAWIAIGGGGSGSVNPTPLVGINATADTTNRLSVSSAASLFNHSGTGHQQKINKNTVGDTASQLYQTNFSGRAEIGLTGDDDFHFKVSADGTTFVDALILDKTTGAVTHKAGARSTFAHDATNAGLNIVPAAGDPSTLANGDIWYNATTGKFRKRQGGATSDLDTAGGGTAMPTVQTFTSSGTWTKPTGCQRVRVRIVGGGGGGAGATAAASACCCGSGGQAGGYAEAIFDVTAVSSEAITIGAAGSAGLAANGAGGNGGTTSFGSLLTATGGRGGTGLASGTAVACVTSDHNTTAGTGGFVNCVGAPGGPANRESATIYVSGFGGSSPLGSGGAGRSSAGTGSTSAAGLGVAASGYGAGGGGAASVSASGFAGAAGTAGFVIVEEFY